LGDDLKSLIVGLGWSTSEEVDLDASCVLLRFLMKKDHAFFKDTKSLCGSVVHSGDNRRGGDG
jgi:stress response protein SCP2